MLRRLPISLRFDDEESDFYFGFIEQKKNDRELSSLILDLLHVYYENDNVKQIVDDYVVSKSPYMQIHAELERIALEHNRQTVTTHMVKDFTGNEQKKATEPPKASSSESENSNSSDKSKDEEIKQLSSEVKDLKDMMKLLMDSPMMSGIRAGVQPEKSVVEPVVEEPKVVSEVVRETSKVEVAPIVEEKVVVEEEVVVPPTFNLEIKKPTSNKEEEVKQELPVTTDEAPAVKKPASFGKLLSSVQ